MSFGHLYGVSVGPGAPDLLTRCLGCFLGLLFETLRKFRHLLAEGLPGEYCPHLWLPGEPHGIHTAE